MKSISGNALRSLFLEYFKEQGHAIEPSAPLVPIDDDSLLWINSGVATLKKYFDGRIIPGNPRIANAQKSIRTNDIENVGFTPRHHTFFEMLGNFSIGDYFKEEAIRFAWEFLTNDKWLGFDEALLYVTIHPEDREAYSIWHEKIGLDDSRIIRIEGNFWDIGEGPCGPQTEIFYDRGQTYGQDAPEKEMYPGGENDRYLEVWNVVFSEFNHNTDGTYTPLPTKNIDTGLGLERVASILQEGATNFDTDFFAPIIKSIETLSGHSYGEDARKDTAFKVISDHIRTVVFAISDGALPSNEGRGYVLRRLIRRAVRFSKELGINEAFMYTLVDDVVKIMSDFYPNVAEKKSFVKEVIQKEELRFLSTLDEGLTIYEALKEKALLSDKVIHGRDAFQLYDTYGFPFELTREYAHNDGLAVDEEGFDKEMLQQKTRARSSRKESSSMHVQSETLASIKDESSFIGYEVGESRSPLLAIVHGDESVDSYSGDDEVELIFKATPFYATSGGQVADTGRIHNESGAFKVTRVYKGPNGQHVHVGQLQSGTLNVDTLYSLSIDTEKRNAIIKNHTATHLLHQALKDVLGDHVNQAGSLVEAERLRFDFSHIEGLKKEELIKIEDKVNTLIFNTMNVSIKEMPIEDAKALGARALFGEKYGDVVRVVNINDYSIELCGGVHVANTSEIGLFKIVSETGIGAGVRRIEAVTSHHALSILNSKERQLESIARQLKVKEENVLKRIEELNREIKIQAATIKSLKTLQNNNVSGDIASNPTMIGDIKVITHAASDVDNKGLRELMDEVKSKAQDAVIAMGAAKDGRVSLMVTVPKALTSDIKANVIMGEMARIVDGKGGGKPDSAQGGGTNANMLGDALAFVHTHIKNSQ